MKDERAYLLHAIDAIDAILGYTSMVVRCSSRTARRRMR